MLRLEKGTCLDNIRYIDTLGIVIDVGTVGINTISTIIHVTVNVHITDAFLK